MIQTDIFDYLYPTYKITKPIRLIELFAGVGSQAMALRDLGADFEHYRVVEIDRYAMKSYNAIHGTNFKISDITKLQAEDMGISDKDKYEYIMTYSFPCQDLSKAGKQKGMEKGSGTRSGLLWEVERLLLELKERDELPQVLIMENVPEVIGAKNYSNFMAWYSSLESIGYQSYYKLLNAKDYGVPQSRNRCFMVSVLGNYSYTFEGSIPLTKCLRDVLEDEVDEKYYLSEDKAQSLTDKCNFKTENDIANTVRASGRSSLDRHTWDVVQIGNCMPTTTRDNPNQGRGGCNRQPFILQNSHGFNKGGVKEICPTVTAGAFKENNFVIGSTQANAYKGSLDGCCPTLTQAMGTGGGQIPMAAIEPILERQRIRKLTPLECWRLMGFNDEDFRKAAAVNSNTQLYKQAGNSIVKQVLMAVIRPLIGKEK